MDNSRLVPYSSRLVPYWLCLRPGGCQTVEVTEELRTTLGNSCSATEQKIWTLGLASLGACYGEVMSDNSVVRLLREFVAEREWSQFHSSSNLAKSISIEAGELLECFQWGEEAEPMRVQSELADVLTYAYLLADRLGLDPDTIVAEKLEETRTKYPVEKARGRSSKYDEL